MFFIFIMKSLGEDRTVLSSFGPYEIIDMLKPIGEDERRKLVHELDKPALAHLAYFLKYFERFLPDFASEVESRVIGEHHKHIDTGSMLPYAISDYSKKEREIIYQNIMAFQAGFGCGGACTFCGLDAVPVVRDRMPLEHQIALFEDIGTHSKRQHPLNYYANDILETIDNVEDYERLSYHFLLNLKSSFNGKTSIPSGKEELYKELCIKYKGGVPVSASFSDENIRRLRNRGIVKISSLSEIKSWQPEDVQFAGLIFPYILEEIFVRGLEPRSVSLRYKQTLHDIGINRNRNKIGYSICESGTIITPYGPHNVMSTFGASDRYPQGQAVVSIGRLSSKPLKIEKGNRVENYLTHSVLINTTHKYGAVRNYKLRNLSSSANVSVNTEGIVVNIF